MIKGCFQRHLPAAGTAHVTLQQRTTNHMQLQVYYQSPADAEHPLQTPIAPYHLDLRCDAAGWYYIFIFNESPLRDQLAYTLTVTYP